MWLLRETTSTTSLLWKNGQKKSNVVSLWLPYNFNGNKTILFLIRLYFGQFCYSLHKSEPSDISVVLTLVAPSTIKSPIAVGLASFPIRTLHVFAPKACVRSSTRIQAWVGVFLREERWVGPELVSLEGQEGLRRLRDEGWTMNNDETDG